MNNQYFTFQHKLGALEQVTVRTLYLTLERFYYPPHFAQVMNFPTKGKETSRESNELRTHKRREYKNVEASL